MGRTNVDLDDEACRMVMERYHLASKREAVSFALRTVAAEPLDLDHARALRGVGTATSTIFAPTPPGDPDRHVGSDRVPARHR
jgi:Arc/MetJ family transcription regulator